MPHLIDTQNTSSLKVNENLKKTIMHIEECTGRENKLISVLN